MGDDVRVGAWRGGLGCSGRRVVVGDRVMRLVRLDWPRSSVEPLFLVEVWETFERVPQVERSARAGVWASERAALVRLVEHVYEHEPVSSRAHRAAAGWLVRTGWGRTAA